MAQITQCDNCKKVVKNRDKVWRNSVLYNLTGEEMEIKKQQVVVEARISLKCGDPLDLCDSCAWNILRDFIN